MKILLLIAKYIASKNNTDIRLEYLKCASKCVEMRETLPIEQQLLARRTLFAINKIDVVNPNLYHKYTKDISKKVLKQMNQAAIIDYSDCLREFIDKHDYIATLTKNIGENDELFTLKSSPKQYIESLLALEQLKTNLLDEVFGQEPAIEALVDTLARSQWDIKQSRPRGIFLFLGPPATGKTFLAQRFSHHLSNEYRFRTFDMTQYTNANEAFGLMGGREGYSDATTGQLTQFIKHNPKSIVLFDEFEKAHTQVLQSLLEMLSTGSMIDQYSLEEISCREVIIIFSSNLGSSLYNNTRFLEILENRPNQAKASILEHIAKETKIQKDMQVTAVPAELLSRLSQGSVLLFKKLDFTDLLRLANNQISTDFAQFKQVSGIDISLSDNLLNRLFIFAFAPRFDVREIKTSISSFILDRISDFVRKTPNISLSSVICTLDKKTHDYLESVQAENLQRHLFIKNLTINFETLEDVNSAKNQLTLTFSQLKEEKLIQSEDIGVSGGLVTDVPLVSFKDIAGHHFIKKRLKETLSLLKNRERLNELGVSLPKGMLLYGPPGTGKTMLAKAFAHEAQLPFISCSGNDLLSETFINNVFKRARDYAPCIIFVDELDALPKRGSMGAIADALVNQLLTEIDGFETTEQSVFVIGATNRKDSLDAALVRSGRLDLHLKVPHLDKDARRWFIEKQLTNPLYEDNIDIELVLLMSAGLSGADLERVHRESVLAAVMNQHSKINQNDLVEQINILQYGAKRDKKSVEHELSETAFHESAHAVLSKVLIPERPIEQITIIAREHALGMVSYSQEHTPDYTKDYLFSLTCVALAGRAAQVKQFGAKGLDTGACSDLEQAMHYTWLATIKLGMLEPTYNMDLAQLEETSSVGLFRTEKELLIKEWLSNATNKTDMLIEQHWDNISAVANELLKQEILGDKELSEIIKGP